MLRHIKKACQSQGAVHDKSTSIFSCLLTLTLKYTINDVGHFSNIVNGVAHTFLHEARGYKHVSFCQRLEKKAIHLDIKCEHRTVVALPRILLVVSVS